MRAAVFHGAHDIRVEDVDAPDSPGPGEVLLRPSWCGICGTDLHEYAMGPIVIPAAPHRLNGSQLPQILGHEFSAEIVEVGREVTNVTVGQRVSVMPLLFCGECYYCRRGLNHLCVSMACIGLSFGWGGIAELAVVPATHVSVLPDDVTDLQGALVEPAAVAAYGVDTAGVAPGDTVLVTGAGPIGALAALYASAAGANVVVSEVNPVRAALARSLDVGEVLDPSEVDPAAWIKDRNDGIGFDAVIECSGNERALQTAVAAVRSGGRISQTGLHTKAGLDRPDGALRARHHAGGHVVLPGVRLAADHRADLQRALPGGEGGDRADRDGRCRRVRFRDPALADRRSDQGPGPSQVVRPNTQLRDKIIQQSHSGGRMKALQYQEQGVARVAELDIPQIADDEVLVAARSVGVCHSDIDLLEGRYIIPFSYPLIPGHEWSGEVVAVGAKVTALRPGDRVVGECVIGADHFGFSISGAAAEFFVAQARMAAPAARPAVVHDGRPRRAVQRRLLRAGARGRRGRE